MKSTPSKLLALTALLFSFLAPLQDEATAAANPYAGWQRSGAIVILTTPDGANLPAGSSVEAFPLLVRLDKDGFDFGQAKPDGADIRFSADGKALPYQIEQWDAAKGTASVWVRIPRIQGNARQAIALHWGKTDAASESNGSAVFNESNGHLAVWHMNGPVTDDEVGVIHSKDAGTTASAGAIGAARHFPGGKGVFCGEDITTFPTGSQPHSSSVWFRGEKPNCRVLSWGKEQGQGKVQMWYRSPSKIRMDCYFSDADVSSSPSVPLNQWVHVVHTYEKGESRVYVNGALDAVATRRATPLNIPRPARMWIGGWYNNYDFAGDIDEVRISKVVRSPDWIRLQYENQKPLQTLTGPVAPPGNAFLVSPAQVTMLEGTSATLSAKAGGAQKIYWILKSEGRETIVAVDRVQFTLDAGRVTGDKSATLQFKAICANEVKTRDIPIRIQEAIPEPVFTLKAPAAWDGRTTIEVQAQVANVAAMQAKGAGELATAWSVSDIAVIKETAQGKLILTRAQNSGKMTVTATVSNGGTPSAQSITITVTEPKRDAWVARTPAKDEKPTDNQFYARDDKGKGTLHYNGTLAEAADSVFLKVYADDKPYKSESKKLGADKSYAFAVKLEPGLVKYRVEFGSKTGGRETALHKAGNLVCGDAYIIQGQSNAVATDFGKEDPTFRSEWIRTFGSERNVGLWGDAQHRSRGAQKLEIGYWGMELGRRIVEAHKIPVFIINGARGGTRIDQHQRNRDDPTDAETIYGRLLTRVRQARLTHGIRGVLWHQGENDQGAAGPTGGFGWETYQQYFIDMAAAWKQDYPNIQNYHIFQIWPKSCSMGTGGSDDMLREVQRTLPRAFSNMSVMSTLGIRPAGTCHYPAAGYAKMAQLVYPLVARDHYGVAPKQSITPPALVSARYTSARRDQIALTFDQPVAWDNAVMDLFRLDSAAGKVTAGAATGKEIRLKLAAPSTARPITYVSGEKWRHQMPVLRGQNGIAALTFCNVPLSPTP
ncbi:DUF2341 domain-containing protein [bacterium]|nr:DUF2341 domain-containing protein [bacterium]